VVHSAAAAEDERFYGLQIRGHKKDNALVAEVHDHEKKTL